MSVDDDTISLEQGVLFEEGYLTRTHKLLTSSPDIALTELVANAWDAGATFVKITIPKQCNELLIVKDNGCGMSEKDFSEHWMTLSYNRQKHQGKWAATTDGSRSRLAYGRNGIGRHGLLCFGENYTVITTHKGHVCNFEITSKGDQPLTILKKVIYTANNPEEHGTELQVKVQYNRPDPTRILNTLAARFVADPSFTIYVNGESISVEDLTKSAETAILTVEPKIKLEILFIDTEKAARKSIYQGIAFWQQNRLVGEPSWILGKDQILDGRTAMAKRYIFIVKSDDLGEFVASDWSGFIPHKTMDNVYATIAKHVRDVFAKLNQDNLAEIKSSIKDDYKSSYATLSPLGKFEVDEAITHIVTTRPSATPETISLAVEAVINLEQTRSGKALLQKLSQLRSDEISALDELLENWSVKDALTVLDEIDKRITVIEAISKLSSDPEVDELTTLHPLITEARWVFGPEFDSPEYASNRQLQTIAKHVLHVEDANFINPQKRPDLFVKGDRLYSITGTESYDTDEISAIEKILIIELKRGGFTIGKTERNQAQGYVDDFLHSGGLPANVKVFAFIVGDSIENISDKIDVGDNGHVKVITFASIVDTANRRLFRLRNTLNERYAKVSGIDLSKKVEQMNLL